MNKDNILESVNRGIKLAIDSFDFDEQPVNNTTDIIDSNDEELELGKHVINKLIKENMLDALYYLLNIHRNDLSKLTYLYRELGISLNECKLLVNYFKKSDIFEREYVDLDLPSGTLWCTENLDKMDLTVTLNGTEYNANNGSYYIWGNTKPNPKEDSSNNFKRAKDYYIKALQDKNVEEVLLQLEDDAAYKVNKHYRTPKYDDFEELFKNTNMVTLKLDDYTRNLGYLLVSKKDPFKFIWFPYEEDGPSNKLYLTSELIRSANTNIYINFAKLKQNMNGLKFGIHSYQLWQNVLIPNVVGKIRPIYVE